MIRRGELVKELRVVTLLISLFLLVGCNELGFSFNNPILIVDLDAVAKATGRQELMQKELEFANLRLTEQLKLVASQLEDSVSEEKDKLGKSPTSKEKQQLETLVLQAQQQLVNSKNLAVQQSSEFRSDLILRFREEVKNIALNIAKRSGSKLVLISNYETIWFDPAADITDEVIAQMRAGSIGDHQDSLNSSENPNLDNS